MPQISTLNAMLTASITGFTAGMSAGGSAVGAFGEAFSSAAGVVTAAVAAMGIDLSLQGIEEFIKKGFEAVEATGKMAEQLGVTTESLGRLQYAAELCSVPVEDLDKALGKMLKSLGNLSDGQKAAVEAFDKLGLTTKDFVGLGADQAFLKIAGAINAMSTSGDRAKVINEVLGKAAGTLIPLMRESSEKLRKTFAEADTFGKAINGIDTAKVEMAHESFMRLQGAVEGAGEKLAVELAPYLDTLAKQLVDVTQNGKGMAATLVDGVESTVKAVTYAADYVHAFDAGWFYVKAEALEAMSAIEGGIENMLTIGNGLLGFFHIPSEDLDGIRAFIEATQGHQQAEAADALSKMAGQFAKFEVGSATKSAGEFFDKLKSGAEQAAEAMAKALKPLDVLGSGISNGTDEAIKKLDKLHEQVEMFGKSAAEKAAAEVGELGGTVAQQAEASALAKQLDQLEAHKKATEEAEKSAKHMFEETRTPAEKYGEAIEKIQEAFASGFIDSDVMSREMQKAQDDLDKTLNKMDKVKHFEVDTPRGLVAGSSDAADFVAKFQAQQRENQHEAAIAKNTETTNLILTQIAKQKPFQLTVMGMGGVA